MYLLIDKYGEDYVPEVCYKVFDDGDTIPSTQISSKTKLLNKEKVIAMATVSIRIK